MLSRKETAIAFLQAVISGNIREAYDAYVAVDFRHHNPYFQGDAASLMNGMQENEAQFPGKTLKVERALEDGEFVAVHSHLQLKPGMDHAVVHLFRFVDGRIVELWDVGQAVPAEIKNAFGMF